MKLSNRITNITGGGSDGWDVFLRARRMIADGTPVTELTIGEHDVPTSDAILDVMHASAKGGHTGYAMVPGTHELRKTVAARIASRTGVATTADNILITPGGQAALFSAHVAVCDAGDLALFVDPYYATYPGTIRAVRSAMPRMPATVVRRSYPTNSRVEPSSRFPLSVRSRETDSPPPWARAGSNFSAM